jgi:hypothetical protein
MTTRSIDWMVLDVRPEVVAVVADPMAAPPVL